MTRGKQKIEAQRRNAERNQKAKGSQLEARVVGLKVGCPICKVLRIRNREITLVHAGVVGPHIDDPNKGLNWSLVQLANHNQLVDHYASKHPKEKPPSESGG